MLYFNRMKIKLHETDIPHGSLSRQARARLLEDLMALLIGALDP